MAIEITSKDNQTVKDIAKLMSSAKERRNRGMFVAEGLRLCGEVPENGIEIEELLYTEEVYLKHTEEIEKLEKQAKKAYLITEEISQKISDTLTPQGVFCTGRMKNNTLDTENMKIDGQYVLLENIQDPSNVGAIFRTAEAIGLNGAILSADCCDLYNPKVMRAGMGATFRFPFAVVSDVPAFIKKIRSAGMRPLASVPDSDASKITCVRFFKGVIMCVGNEGNGLTQETINACGERVTIPMKGRAESLNAATAASIMMWEMTRNYV